MFETAEGFCHLLYCLGESSMLHELEICILFVY